MLTYQATTEKYDPSDGVSVDVGDLDLRNVLVVSEDGEDGILVMTVVNTSDDDVELGVQFGEGGGDTQTVDIEAGATAAFGADEVEGIDVLDPIVLEGIDTMPGALLTMYFQYGDAEGIQKQVPVLDARLPEYNHLSQ
jgi:hypothetical protein